MDYLQYSVKDFFDTDWFDTVSFKPFGILFLLGSYSKPHPELVLSAVYL